MSEIVLVAIIGVLGTLLAGPVTASFTRAADERRARQARRMDLYVGLNRVAIRDQRMLDRLAANRHETLPTPDNAPGHLDAITAEVDLVAGSLVQEAWEGLSTARDTALWNFEQDHPEPDPEIPTTDPDWIRLSQAALRLRAATRTETDDALKVWQRRAARRSFTTGSVEQDPH